MHISAAFEISAILRINMLEYLVSCMSSWQYTIFRHETLHIGYYLDTHPSQI